MTEAEFIPADLADTVARLENWGRWAVERQKRGHAASAEGRYRPRRGNNESEEDELERLRRGSVPPIDQWDAMRVGKVLAPANGFPIRQFVLLRAKYFHRSKAPVICRQLNLRTNDYGTELNKALTIARNRLTFDNTHA